MPLSELSRQQLIQKRREDAEKSTSPAPAPEPSKKPVKMKETSIFAPDDPEGNTDEYT